ncbi:hypothetical protein ACJZ2D_012455 [Fusarium nematophilum]
MGPSKYGLLLTFGNVSSLLDQRLSSYSHLESESGYVSIEKGSPFIGIESYPPSMFDKQQSLVLFTTNPDKTEQVAVTMLRLGTFHRAGCVLMFGIRVLASGDALWFCDTLPPDSWHASERRRLGLLRLLEDQVSARTTSFMHSSFPDLRLSLSIFHEVKAFPGAVVRSAHLFPKGEGLRPLSDEVDDDSDTGSNCATIQYRGKTLGSRFKTS